MKKNNQLSFIKLTLAGTLLVLGNQLLSMEMEKKEQEPAVVKETVKMNGWVVVPWESCDTSKAFKKKHNSIQLLGQQIYTDIFADHREEYQGIDIKVECPLSISGVLNIATAIQAIKKHIVDQAIYHPESTDKCEIYITKDRPQDLYFLHKMYKKKQKLAKLKKEIAPNLPQGQNIEKIDISNYKILVFPSNFY